MLSVSIQNIGPVAEPRCAGRIVADDEAHILRKAVLSQTDIRIVVLDLAGVDAIDGGGMGLLVFLRAWARPAGIELKLTNITPRLRSLLAGSHWPRHGPLCVRRLGGGRASGPEKCDPYRPLDGWWRSGALCREVRRASGPRRQGRAYRRRSPAHGQVREEPGGTPIEVFDSFRKALAQNRAQFFLDVASGPFYGFNRPGAKASQGIIQNWWRQGMMGSALAHYEGIKAFSETDQTDDLKAITVPTLVLQGDDDQVVPYKDASVLQARLLQHGTLKIYPGFSHGMMTTNADVINADILAFIKGAAVKAV